MINNGSSPLNRHEPTPRALKQPHTNLTLSQLSPKLEPASYAVTIRWNRLFETIPTSGHTIGIGW